MGRILEAAEAAAVLADALTSATDEMAEEDCSGEGTQIGQLQSQARDAAEAARDGPTAHLARFVATWRPATIPAPLCETAKRALIDILGTALAGSASETSILVSRLARREAARGPAAVIGHGYRISATYAALVNGTSGHALDFDDIGAAPGVGHPTVSVAPAAIAVADEVGASGRQLLEAIIVGHEIVSRVGRASGGSSGDTYRRGFHGTAVHGVFGATAAAARLLGLDVGQTRCAFGIAASEAGGVRANVGTMAKPLHAGEVNRAGVMAAHLAEVGFTANQSAIEARSGWGDAFTGGSMDRTFLEDGLGHRFAMEQGVNVKSFPSCAATHPVIRAMLSILSEYRLSQENIDGIEVEISQQKLDGALPFPWPATGLEGKFSLAYNVAAALADGDVTVGTFTEGKLLDLGAYRSRIAIRGLEGLQPTLIRVRTSDGRELTSPGLPEPRRMPDTDPRAEDGVLHRKFRTNVSSVRPAERADELLGVIGSLELATSLRQLTDLLL